MEAIREYLNNLFLNIPETSEVLRAKAELMEMMEDKYEELIREGKSEQEAVGIVISEFGNFEELASELGIGEYVKAEEKSESKENNAAPKKKKPTYSWGVQDVEKFLEFAKRHACYMAAAIAICILTPFMSSMIEEINLPIMDAVSACLFFAMVAAAVLLFSYTSRMTKNAIKLKNCNVILEEQGAKKLAELIPIWENKRFVMRTIGILICIFSVLPSTFSEYFSGYFGEFLDNSFLLLVAIGVFLIVYAQSVGNRFMELSKSSKGNGEPDFVQRVSWDYHPKEMPAGAILAIVFGSIAIFGVIIFTGIASFFGDSSETGKMSKAQQTFSKAAFAGVDLEVSACELQILSVEGLEQIEYNFEGNVGKEPSVDMVDGVLKVQESGKINWKPFGGNSKRTMIIRIPKEMEGESEDFTYNINVDAGDIRMEGIEGGKLLLDVDAGNIIATECSFSQESKCEVAAGNLELRKADFEDVKVEVNAGNFLYEFANPEKQSEYSYNLHADLGKITVGGEECKSDYKKDSGEKIIKAELDMGNIEVKY